MPLSDIVIPIVILACTLTFLLRQRRRGLRGVPLAAATWCAFFGLALVASMTAHCLEISYHLLAGGTGMGGDPWRYDFRSYGLLLLGSTLIWQGARCLRAASDLHAAPAAGREARHATAIALAVVAPLIPIHAFFALPLTALGLFGLLVLARIRPAGPVQAPPRAPVLGPATAEV